jgi:hypothetical protein
MTRGLNICLCSATCNWPSGIPVHVTLTFMPFAIIFFYFCTWTLNWSRSSRRYRCILGVNGSTAAATVLPRLLSIYLSSLWFCCPKTRSFRVTCVAYASFVVFVPWRQAWQCKLHAWTNEGLCTICQWEVWTLQFTYDLIQFKYRVLSYRPDIGQIIHLQLYKLHVSIQNCLVFLSINVQLQFKDVRFYFCRARMLHLRSGSLLCSISLL